MNIQRRFLSNLNTDRACSTNDALTTLTATTTLPRFDTFLYPETRPTRFAVPIYVRRYRMPPNARLWRGPAATMRDLAIELRLFVAATGNVTKAAGMHRVNEAPDASKGKDSLEKDITTDRYGV